MKNIFYYLFLSLALIFACEKKEVSVTGVTLTNKAVTWSSSNTAAATVATGEATYTTNTGYDGTVRYYYRWGVSPCSHNPSGSRGYYWYSTPHVNAGFYKLLLFISDDSIYNSNLHNLVSVR